MKQEMHIAVFYTTLASFIRLLFKGVLRKESGVWRGALLKGSLCMFVLLLFAQFVGGGGAAYAQRPTATHGNMLTSSTHSARPEASGCHTSKVTVYFTGGNAQDFHCSGDNRVDIVGVGGVQPEAWSGYLHSRGTTYWWKFCDYTYALIPDQEIDDVYLSPTNVC